METMKTKKYILILISGMFLFNISYGQIRLRISDTTTMSGNIIDIPVYADSSLTGKNILSFQLQINYNSAYYNTYITPISIINTGTLSQSFGSLTTNLSIPGKIIVAGAGATPLTGNGKLFIIRIQTLQPACCVYFTNGTAVQSFFNEGSPAINWVNGNLSITAMPTVTINQNSGILSRGETMQFTATGGTTPYQWSVTNNSVASINSSGLLTANNVGFTKVRVQTANSLIDTTDAEIEVRGMKLRMPDTSAWQGSYVNIPVYTTSLTNLGIMSGSFTISYNQSLLTAVDIVTANSMLNNYSISFNFNTPGTISFSFAGADTLTGSGKLMYVRFQVSSTNTGSNALQLSNVVFNQNLSAITQNGAFTTINFAVINITPGTAELVAGETQQFSSVGGILPYTWSTTDTAIATINSSGLLTAKKSGYIKVNVQDNVGATAQTSGFIKVYDTYVTIPNTNGSINASCIIPVNIGNLPSGQSVSSIQGIITFKSPELQFVEILTDETMCNGWSFSFNLVGNQLFFAGAGSSSFSTMGTMFKLKFQTTASLTLGEFAWVNITEITLNQGIPLPKVQNGNIIGSLDKTVNLKLYLEGFFNGTGLNKAQNENGDNFSGSIADRINIELHNSNPPFILEYTTLNKDLLTNGNCQFTVPSNYNASYYVVVKHRNSIEIWSSLPISFSGNDISYDFTTDASKVYGDNQKQVQQGKFAMFVGDVNQDGVVDLSDLVDMDTDLTNGTVAYIVYDLNGDGVVDLSDLVIIDENLTNGAVVMTP
jgi:hypothetical protein